MSRAATQDLKALRSSEQAVEGNKCERGDASGSDNSWSRSLGRDFRCKVIVNVSENKLTHSKDCLAV